MNNPTNQKMDNGVIVPKRRYHISWVWLFPIMAASAAGYMFAHDWFSRGPEIVIEFANAPGIRAGKTFLIYRGVVGGTVDRVELDSKLQKVLVYVQLQKFAEGIAREGTTFWIDQPVLSLSGASGIESLIDGNSIQTVMGSGPATTRFIGSEIKPIITTNKAHEGYRLRGSIEPFLERGSPVNFRGVTVGVVTDKDLDSDRQPYLDILIEGRYASLVRSKARFWVTPPTSVKIGSGILKVNFAGLKTLLNGAITFDYFGDEGDPVKDEEEFPLFANESVARANSEPITLEFKDGQGLMPGETQLRYLGLPVGIVEKVFPSNGKAVVTARLMPGYENLRRKGTVFSVIRPAISLQKISGLETLVSGIYIDCIPGSGGPEMSRFQGMTQDQAELIQPGDPGFRVVVQSPSTKIAVGSEVHYRGLVVGRVVKKGLSSSGDNVNLSLSIDTQYAALLHENTRFWDSSGVKISGAIISLNVRAPALESKALACIEFSTPEGADAGESVKPGHVYELYDSPKKEWLKWIPSLPGK